MRVAEGRPHFAAKSARARAKAIKSRRAKHRRHPYPARWPGDHGGDRDVVHVGVGDAVSWRVAQEGQAARDLQEKASELASPGAPLERRPRLAAIELPCRGQLDVEAPGRSREAVAMDVASGSWRS